MTEQSLRRAVFWLTIAMAIAFFVQAATTAPQMALGGLAAIVGAVAVLRGQPAGTGDERREAWFYRIAGAMALAVGVLLVVLLHPIGRAASTLEAALLGVALLWGLAVLLAQGRR